MKYNNNSKKIKILIFIFSLIIFLYFLLAASINGGIIADSNELSTSVKGIWLLGSLLSKLINCALSYQIDSSFFSFYLDGINVIFCALTAFFFSITILATWNMNYHNAKVFYGLLFATEVLTLIFFLSSNLFVIFMAFELVLIPLVLLITNWSTSEGRIYASYLFFLFTSLSSLPFLASIIFIYFKIGSVSIIDLHYNLLNFNNIEKMLITTSFFIAFAVKIPVFPFHTWLTEAHVEAAKPVSIILASVMLKTGIYAFIKFFIPLFFVWNNFLYFFNYLVIFSILYSAMAALVQTDVKKIIAYSSISHMNFALLGILMCTKNTILASIFIAVGHAIISAGLFFLIGIFYKRFHVKDIHYIGGIGQIMPVFSLFFAIFIIANSGFPASLSFWGEILIFFNVYNFYGVVGTTVIGFSLLINAIVNFKLLINICFNTVNSNFISKWYYDLTYLEIIICIVLVTVLCISFFFMPGFIENCCHYEIENLISSSSTSISKY